MKFTKNTAIDDYFEIILHYNLTCFKCKSTIFCIHLLCLFRERDVFVSYTSTCENIGRVANSEIEMVDRKLYVLMKILHQTYQRVLFNITQNGLSFHLPTNELSLQ